MNIESVAPVVNVRRWERKAFSVLDVQVCLRLSLSNSGSKITRVAYLHTGFRLVIFPSVDFDGGEIRRVLDV
jgi:hypothetical protein